MNHFCWVYITRDPQAENKLLAAIADDLPQMLRDSAERQVIYYRQFNNTLDAVAHKLLLTNLENNSLYDLIRSLNPTVSDLREDFREKS